MSTAEHRDHLRQLTAVDRSSADMASRRVLRTWFGQGRSGAMPQAAQAITSARPTQHGPGTVTVDRSISSRGEPTLSIVGDPMTPPCGYRAGAPPADRRYGRTRDPWHSRASSRRDAMPTAASADQVVVPLTRAAAADRRRTTSTPPPSSSRVRTDSGGLPPQSADSRHVRIGQRRHNRQVK